MKLHNLFEQAVTEYNRPDNMGYGSKKADDTFKRAFGKSSGVLDSIKQFFKGNWTPVVSSATHSGFRQLKQAGLNNDQINEFRHQLHSVLGGFYKSHGYKVIDRKLSKGEPGWGSVISKSSVNFSGWGVPLGVAEKMTDKHWDQIESQVIANINKKFKIGIDFSKETSEAVNEEEWGVYSKGGSIGSKPEHEREPVKTYDNKPDAQAAAKRMRKNLSPGERGYYGMGYSVKQIKECLHSINEMLNNPVLAEDMESAQEAFNEKLKTLKHYLQDAELMMDPETKQAVQKAFHSLMAKASSLGLDTTPRLQGARGASGYGEVDLTQESGDKPLVKTIGMGDTRSAKEISEDWGSSDWYPIMRSIDQAIEERGFSPATIKAAAYDAAEFYGEDMGYDNVDDATQSIISHYIRNNTKAQAMSRMLAPVKESSNLRTARVTYNNGDVITTNLAATATDEMIRNYFRPGKRVNIGDGAGGDNVVTIVDVEILDENNDDMLESITPSNLSVEEMLTKLKKVIDSVYTKQQMEVAEKYASTMFKRIKEYAKKTLGSNQALETTLDFLIDLEAQLSMKKAQFGVLRAPKYASIEEAGRPDVDASDDDIDQAMDKKLASAFSQAGIPVYNFKVNRLGDDDWYKITAKGAYHFRRGAEEKLQFKIKLLWNPGDDEAAGEAWSQQHHADSKYSQHLDLDEEQLSIAEIAKEISEFVITLAKADAEKYNQGERDYWAKGGTGMTQGAVHRDYKYMKDDIEESGEEDLNETPLFAVGDKVKPKWDNLEAHIQTPLEVTGVRGDQIRVKDEYGNSAIMDADDLVAHNAIDAAIAGEADIEHEVDEGDELEVLKGLLGHLVK